MSLDLLPRLATKWFPCKGAPFQAALDAVFDQIGFTDDPGFVASSIEAYRSGFATRNSKVIKDSVWGMVEFDPQSIRLLESPIVQRLRGIKQLGFSYLTYPSAEHSRFIHSLGMYCVVARFIEAIDKQAAEPRGGEQPPYQIIQVDGSLKRDLLHASILHDIGHVPFSHASEKIFEADVEKFQIGNYALKEFLFDVQDILEKSLPLSECISLAVILSPRFRKFYEEYVRPGEGDPDAVYRIAALIAGIRPRPELRGAADLISEDVVDADKVDYVNRDALACGIPVGVDVARLFLRSCFFRVPREHLKRLHPNREPMADEEIIFVVNASGIDTIEELAQARSALYQRVYLHQATRNAERLLGHAIVAAADNPGAADVPDLTDVIQVWALDDYGLLHRLANHENSRAAGLALRLRTRGLPKRSCVFGRRVISTIFPIREIFPAISEGDEAEIFRQITGLPLQDLRESKLSGQALRDLEAAIVGEASKIAAIVRDQMPGLVPESDKPDLVSVLPMPKLENKLKDCIILENNELCYSGDLTISDEQAEGADIYKSLGYTMADPEWRKIVLLAAQTVLYRRRMAPRPISLRPYAHDNRQSFDVKCVGHITLDISKVVRRVGLDAAAVQEIQRAAEDGGYYENMPRLASPISPEGDATTIAQNLRDFCGQGHWRVTPKTCAAFIEQFPPGLRQEAIKLLRQVNILDRPTLSAEIIQAVEKYGAPKSGKGYIVALSPDSGNFVRMLVEQELRDRLMEMRWSIAKSIHEVFGKAKRGEDLILCDDNTVSGSQAECQFLAWFAIPRDRWAPDQRSEQGIEDLPLDDRDLDLLRSMHLGIAVCRGSVAAADRLGPRLKSLGIAKFHGLYSAGDVTPEDVDLSDPLKTFLGNVGSDVLAYCRYGASGGATSLSAEERTDCEENSLGYGNARGLLSTVYNVPVSTLTALWCPGLFDSEPWMPLLIRRGYLQHLVLA